MEYVPNYRQEPNLNGIELILDTKFADVNGDGVVDEVYLVGRKNGKESIVINDIAVTIVDGKTKLKNKINLHVDKGYEPHLFLKDFSKDGIDDILISIQSGNTGREGYFYIYSFINNIEKLIFNFEIFNQQYKYDVIYEDKYMVNIISKYNGERFKIDISNRSREYLSKIYTVDGALKKPLRGQVSPIIDLHPVNNQERGYDIEAIQRVIGYYNADTLGMLDTMLTWNGNDFIKVGNTNLLLFGVDRNITKKE